jgi:hypothetical protein
MIDDIWAVEAVLEIKRILLLTLEYEWNLVHQETMLKIQLECKK